MSNNLREDLAAYSKELESYLTTSSNFGIVRLDSNLTILECNLGFMRLLGPHQNPVGKLLASYIEMDSSHPQCREELRLRLSRESGKDGIIHCQFIQKEDGYILLCERLVLTESRVIEKMGGMTEELISMQRELIKKNHLLEKQYLELQTANSRIHESEQRFESMADSAPILIWMSGTDKLCTWFNKVWLDFTGRRMEQELGNGWAEGVHPEDFERCLETYTTSFDNRQPFSMEYRLRAADGQYRWLLDNGTPTYAQDIFTGYIGSCTDITDLKILEKELFENSSLLNNIINANPDSIFSKDIDGRYMLINAAAARFIGESTEDVLGRDDYSLFPPDVAEILMEKDCNTIRERSVITFEETVTNSAGVFIMF